MKELGVGLIFGIVFLIPSTAIAQSSADTPGVATALLIQPYGNKWYGDTAINEMAQEVKYEEPHVERTIPGTETPILTVDGHAPPRKNDATVHCS